MAVARGDLATRPPYNEDMDVAWLASPGPGGFLLAVRLRPGCTPRRVT